MPLKKFSVLLCTVSFFSSPGFALFRGDEDKPRDYKISNEFFQDVAAIRAPMDEMRVWQQADQGYFGMAGSVTSNDLYLEQGLKLAIREDNRDGTPAFVGGMEFEEGMDFDGSYRQFVMRGGPMLGDSGWSLQALARLDNRKEYADFGLSLRREEGPSRKELRLTLPNFVFEGKNPDEAVYDQQPFNLLMGWQEALKNGITWWIRSETDFKSETRFPHADNHAFQYESYANRAGLDIPVGAWTLYTMAGQVHTQKAVVWDNPAGYRSELSHAFAILEAIRGTHQTGRVRLGLEYDRLRLDRQAQTQEGKIEKMHRDDYVAYGYYSLPISDKFYMDSGLSFKLGNLSEIPLGQPEHANTLNHPAAKGIVELGFMGKQWAMALSPTLDIDEMKFGGGYGRIRCNF